MTIVSAKNEIQFETRPLNCCRLLIWHVIVDCVGELIEGQPW